MANEAFAHVKIDQLLKDVAGTRTHGRKTDCALFDRQGWALVMLDARHGNTCFYADSIGRKGGLGGEQ